MKRLLGLLLIVRALAPLLIVVVIAVALNVVIQDIHRVLDKPIQTIQTEMVGVKTAVDGVKGDIGAVGRDVTTVVNRLQGFSIPNLIPNIPNSIRIPRLQMPALSVPVPTDVQIQTSSVNIGVTITYPSGITIRPRNIPIGIPDIPNIDIPVPGLSSLADALRNALAPITDVFKDFNKAFGSFNKLNQTLQPLPDHLNAIVNQGQSMLTGLQQVVARWEGTLVIVVAVLLILVVIYFAVPSIADFNRGLRMLRGLPTD